MRTIGLKRHPLFPVFFTFFLDNFGLSVVYPIFTPLFLEPKFGLISADTSSFARTVLFGFLISSFSFAQFFGAPLIGEVSDRFGRKKTFYATILGTTTGYFLTALSIAFGNLPLLFMSRLLTGFFAGNLTLCLAAVADLSLNEHSRTKNFGFIGAAGGLSFIIGIILGGGLGHTQKGDPLIASIPFLLIGALSVINFFLMMFFFRESHQRPQKKPLNLLKGVDHIINVLKMKSLRPIYLIYFFFMICWITSMQFLPTFLLVHYNISTITLLGVLSSIGFIWFFSNFAINRALSTRLHPYQTLKGALFFLTTLLTLSLFFGEIVLFLIIFFLATCFAALCWTNILATVSLSASKETQGCILGINQSIGASAAILGPSIGGFFVGVNTHFIYPFAILASFTAFLISKNHLKHLPKKE